MIRKAVIPAAGHGTRQYPATNAVQKELFPLVDRDGITKPTIQLIAEQALEAGIEEICIIIQPGKEAQFRQHFTGLDETSRPFYQTRNWALRQSRLLEKLNDVITYVEQPTQEGYGHAVYYAQNWVDDEPFLLMLGDHVYISCTTQSCVSQLLAASQKFDQSIFALNQTPSELIYLYGTVTGTVIDIHPFIVDLHKIIEKPDVAYARKNLRIDGLPVDMFLSFFGMHILTPAIFPILEEHIHTDKRENGEIQLTSAQAVLCEREGAIGYEIDGERLDMGTPLGLLETQTALALNGVFSHDFAINFRKMQKLNEC